MTIDQLVKEVVKAADDKRAEDILTLDMKNVSIMADYFVICEGSNERQVRAIARGVKEDIEANGGDVASMEGFGLAGGIWDDFGAVCWHIFHAAGRISCHVAGDW